MTVSPATGARLLIDTDPLDGPTNMARDEILLEQADRYDAVTVRWYQWSPATLSLGYFQNDEPAVRPELPRVRRLSGGGAILHDAEWTYSIAAPRSVIPDVRGLYADVHTAIVRTLASAGLEAAMRGVDRPEIDGAFLCFERGDRHDIVVSRGPAAGRKLVGSAQRRRGRAVLQHGSVALDLPVPTDSGNDAINLAKAFDFQSFVTRVGEHLAIDRLVEAAVSNWSNDELIAAQNWAAEKYSLIDWDRRLRRGPEDIPRP